MACTSALEPAHPNPSRFKPSGAKAVQYRLKELQKRAGLPVAVALQGDAASGWHFLSCGTLMVHCFDRDTRAEAELEVFWGGRDNVTWWRTDERPLTLDNIRAE